MRPLRSLVRALVMSVPLTVLSIAPALAQEAAAEEPGLCAPWHRCVAMGIGAVTVLFIAFLGLNWLIQAKGFHKLEHKQGSPDGVPVGKK